MNGPPTIRALSRQGFSLLGLLAGIIVCACLYPQTSSAQGVRYVYDDLGRLIRVVDESTGQAATYHYDAVGNILSITRETVDELQPQFTGMNPQAGRRESSVDVTITGANLDGSTVTTDNPGIMINDSHAASNAVTATFVIAPDARLGPTNVTVNAGLGSGTLAFTVYPALPRLSFAPRVLALTPGGSAQVNLVLSTSDVFETTVNLGVADTGVATVSPLAATIAAGQVSVPVVVTGGAAGTTVLTATTEGRTAGASVFVTAPFSGDVTAAASAVSVEVRSDSAAQGAAAAPVSVQVEEPARSNAFAPPVSVEIPVP